MAKELPPSTRTENLNLSMRVLTVTVSVMVKELLPIWMARLKPGILSMVN